MSRYVERYSGSPPGHRRRYEYDVNLDPEGVYGAYRPRRRDSAITRPKFVEKVEKLNNRTRFITQTQPPGLQSYGPRNASPSYRYEDREFSREKSYSDYPRARSGGYVAYDREELIIRRRDTFDSESDSRSDAESEASFVLDIPQNQDAHTAESDELLNSVSSEKQPQKKPSEKDQGSYKETIDQVIRSRWLGDERANDISAELTTEHATISAMKTDSQFLMNWIHLESQCPSFDYFVEYVQRLPGLAEDLRQDAIALLQQSRNHELPIYTSGGVRGKYFESFLDQELVAKPNKKNKEQRNIQLLCLPYFSLAQYSGYTLPKSSTLHPTRTLLQYLSASTSRKRDMEQAVCKLVHYIKGQCFHIPQIWCLVLDSEVLLTCSHLPITELQSDMIKMNKVPASQSTAKDQVIRISDEGGRVWMLPAKDCKSWFQFTSRFLEPTSDQEFDDRYVVLHEGSTIDSNSWPELLSRGRPRVDLSIRLKKNPKSQRLSWRRLVDIQTGTETESEEDSEEQLKSKSSVASFIRIHDMSFQTGDQSFDTATENLDPINTDSRSSKSLFDKPTTISSSTGPTNTTFESNEARAPLQNFHYFLWINAAETVQRSDVQGGKKFAKSTASDTFRVNMDELAIMLKSMQTFLDNSNSVKRTAYKGCPSKNFNDVKALLEQSEDSSTRESRGQDRPQSRSRRNRSVSRSRSRRRRPRSSSRTSRERRVVTYTDYPRRDYSGPENTRRGNAERTYVEKPYGRHDRSPPPPRNRISRMKKTFFNAMQRCFSFFFPLEYTSNLIEKYWGAVFHLISRDDAEFLTFYQTFEGSYVRIMDDNLNMMDRLIRVLSKGKGPLPWDINLPSQFGNAWLHLLTFLVYCVSQSSKVNKQITMHELERFESSITKGSKLLVRSMASDPLSEKEAVLPSGLVSVVAMKLLQDATSNQPDISSTYYDYLRNLEHDIQVNPYNRSHQEKIAFLRQEIEAILKVLAEQLQCVSALRENSSPEILEVKYDMRQSYILQDCVLAIKAKIQSFEEMETIASELGIYNIRRIEGNKDRQEAAIMVFTIVTIVFLPLSFVTSFMGMNTKDLRDMGSTQWVFWASAIPITIIVVGLSLIFAHKMEPTREWWGRLKNRFSSSKVQPVFIEKQTAEDLYLATADADPYTRTAVPRSRIAEIEGEERERYARKLAMIEREELRLKKKELEELQMKRQREETRRDYEYREREYRQRERTSTPYEREVHIRRRRGSPSGVSPPRPPPPPRPLPGSRDR